MGEKKEKKKDKEKEKKDKEKEEEKATVRSAPDGSDNYFDLIDNFGCSFVFRQNISWKFQKNATWCTLT